MENSENPVDRLVANIKQSIETGYLPRAGRIETLVAEDGARPLDDKARDTLYRRLGLHGI